MSEELFDLEIKKDFEEEFDAQDIFVSEDLISRTMAAIKSLDEDNIDSSKDNIIDITKNTIESTSTATETEKITDITAPTARKKSFKWVSGIAAALVIGVVGLLIYKVGMGGIKSKSDFTAANYAASTSDNSYSGNKYKDEPKEATQSVKEETSAAAASDRGQYEYDMAVTCAPASEESRDETLSGSNSINDSLKTADTADDVPNEFSIDNEHYINSHWKVSFDATKQDDNEPEDATKVCMIYIDAIIEEIDFSDNNEMLYTDENMEKIRNTEVYQEFMSYREYLGDDEFMSVLKEMYESKTGTANEINIEYLLLEDIK